MSEASQPIDISKATVDQLKQQIEHQKLKYLVPSYVDMHGVPKTKVVPVSFLERMLGGSELFTGAALDGVPQNMSDNEVASVPDPASFTKIPWRDDTAWFSSDLWLEGAPFEACSRGILKRVLAQADEMGYTVNCGIEAEFYVFNQDDKDGTEPSPVSQRHNLDKPAYDAVRLLDNLDHWLSETVDAMNGLGWNVYSFDHEDGIGQFELDFNYSDALTMADRFVFLRVMTGEYARKNGCYASWMPKPFADKAGSGAHYNVSLADKVTGKNLFVAEENDEFDLGLSKLGYHFTAGVMRHLPAIQALAAPMVNSYKRLIVKGSTSGYTWAPCFTSWGGNNRTNTLRVPSEGGRMELRSADSACNPYLGIALMVAAGLEGVREKLEPSPPNDINLYEQEDEQREASGINWLPRTLEEAIDALEKDPLSREVLGGKMFDTWIEFKKEEWLSYQNHVSDWERKRYLRFF